MAVSAPTPKLDRYIVIHVATTCDEHGVYVTKDSAEVIELGWILLDTKTCEEVRGIAYFISHSSSHCPSLSPPPPPLQIPLSRMLICRASFVNRDHPPPQKKVLQVSIIC